MKIESIMSRIESAEAKIGKRRATIEKKKQWIGKKQGLINSGKLAENERRWAEYDIETYKEDIERAERDIKDIEKSLAELMQKMADEQNKAASRNVPAITVFLDAWKAQCKKWYEKRYETFKVKRAEYWAKSEEYSKQIDALRYGRHDDRETAREHIRELERERYELGKNFHSAWAAIEKLDDKACGFEKAVEDMLTADYNAKYDWMMEQVIGITGKIEDASFLRVAETGELNGHIIGEKGAARINTFSAGGWNIQCFHFRTQVRKIA